MNNITPHLKEIENLVFEMFCQIKNAEKLADSELDKKAVSEIEELLNQLQSNSNLVNLKRSIIIGALRRNQQTVMLPKEE